MTNTTLCIRRSSFIIWTLLKIDLNVYFTSHCHTIKSLFQGHILGKTVYLQQNDEVLKKYMYKMV